MSECVCKGYTPLHHYQSLCRCCRVPAFTQGANSGIHGKDVTRDCITVGVYTEDG